MCVRAPELVLVLLQQLRPLSRVRHRAVWAGKFVDGVRYENTTHRWYAHRLQNHLIELKQRYPFYVSHEK